MAEGIEGQIEAASPQIEQKTSKERSVAEQRLSEKARGMRVDWQRGQTIPSVRDYVLAAVATDLLEENLIVSGNVPGKFRKQYESAHLLVQAQRFLVNYGFPCSLWDQQGLWRSVAESLDQAGAHFDVTDTRHGPRVYLASSHPPERQPTGVWHSEAGNEQYGSYLPLGLAVKRLAERLQHPDGELQGKITAEAERLNIHPGLAEMDPELGGLLYQIGQASELVETAQDALSQPEAPGLSPGAAARMRSAHELSLLTRDVLEAALRSESVSDERMAAGLAAAVVPYGLLVDL